MIQPFDFRDLYQFIYPHLDPVLVTPAISKKLLTIQKALPVFHVGLLEIRLGNDQQIDLNICIRKSECNLLVRWIKLSKDPAWEPIERWCEAWMDPELPFKDIVTNTWLIWDIYLDDKAIPIPWMVFGLTKLPVGSDINVIMVRQVLKYTLSELSSAQDHILGKAYGLMPAHCGAAGFGVLEKKSLQKRGYTDVNGDGIRIGISNFQSLEEINDYLLKAEWPGDMDFIREHYADAIALCSYSDLSLVIGETLYPELGIECYLPFRGNYAHAEELLRCLMEKGWCLPSKMEAMLKWIGEETHDPGPWQAASAEQESTLKSVVVRRWILEVKMIFSPGQPPQAKAYLIFERV